MTEHESPLAEAIAFSREHAATFTTLPEAQAEIARLFVLLDSAERTSNLRAALYREELAAPVKGATRRFA